MHGRPSKSDIFWVTAVANSQMCTVSQGNLNKLCSNSWICNCCNSEYIRFKGKTVMKKVAYNVIFSRIRKFDDSQINLVQLYFYYFSNNGKFRNKHCNFFCPTDRYWQNSTSKNWFSYLVVYLVTSYFWLFWWNSTGLLRNCPCNFLQQPLTRANQKPSSSIVVRFFLW